MAKIREAVKIIAMKLWTIFNPFKPPIITPRTLRDSNIIPNPV
jgi:hypothetical protein